MSDNYEIRDLYIIEDIENTIKNISEINENTEYSSSTNYSYSTNYTASINTEYTDKKESPGSSKIFDIQNNIVSIDEINKIENKTENITEDKLNKLDKKNEEENININDYIDITNIRSIYCTNCKKSCNSYNKNNKTKLLIFIFSYLFSISSIIFISIYSLVYKFLIYYILSNIFIYINFHMLITKVLNINTDIKVYLCLEVADDILLLYHIIERKFNLFVDETLKNISISLFYSKFVIRLYIVIKSLIQDIKKNKSIKYKFILSIISNIFLFIIIILGLIYSYLINKLNPSIEYSIWFNYGFNIWILFIIPARIL